MKYKSTWKGWPVLMAAWISCVAAWGQGLVMNCYGLSDASALMALDERYFAVGDDEDNVIRVYQIGGSGRPLQTLELSRFLQVEWRSPEADIEGAARLGNRIYWITSHGRNAQGEERRNRQRFFATDIHYEQGVPRLVPVGRAYQHLLTDLLLDERLRTYQLAVASTRAPKSEGALNIEGLAATLEGHLLIGFRNPIIASNALVVPLLNPQEVIMGYRARFGNPMLLDLQGRGVRSFSDWHGRFLVVGGAVGDGGESKVFEWDGKSSMATPLELPATLSKGFNPESVVLTSHGGVDAMLIISDDGNLKVGGKPQKKIKDRNLRRFRAALIPLAEYQSMSEQQAGLPKQLDVRGAVQ